MKQTYKFLSAVCAMAVILTACTTDETLKTQTIPAVVGDEILFGARAGFENGNPDDTRTVYSGETYKVGGVTFERIDWVDKGDGVELYDQIEIASPDASNGPTAHYDVYHSAAADAENDFAYLVKKDDAALQWKNDDEHTFYAMYPSSRMFGESTTVAQGVSIDKDGIMHATIPLNQPGVASDPKNDGNYVVAPDMRYAYMAAKTTATRMSQTTTEGEEPKQQGINLTFVPVVTAVQVEFTLAATASGGSKAQEIKITDLQIEGEGIVGDYTANLKDWDPKNSSYPACSVDGTPTNQITIPLKEAVTLKAGKKLTFTVFMMPTANLESLKVKFTSTGVFQARTLKKTTNGTFIKPYCKNLINGVDLPASGIKYDLSNWMENLSNDFTMKRLSLPGTGGSFSYAYSSDEGNTDYYKEQTIPVFGDEEAGIIGQWEAGIRAFEIVSDRATNTNTDVTGLATPTKLGNITCNQTSVGVSVTNAMETLINKVKNSDECAVVIFTYQPNGAVIARRMDRYLESLKKWYDGVSDKNVFMKYTPDLELGPTNAELAAKGKGTTTQNSGARGHIMILVRPNQTNEKDEHTEWFSTKIHKFEDLEVGNYPFVLINGCGTAKDRWGARGYKIEKDGVPYQMLHISNSYTNTNYTGNAVYNDSNMIIESYMSSNVLQASFAYREANSPEDYASYTNTIDGGSTYVLKRPMGGNYNMLNFSFETDSNITVYYQEWQRVCPADGQYSWHYDDTNTSGTSYWFESYQEKLNCAEQTFVKAINDTTGNIIYVNSLCGYYIVNDDTHDSAAPSSGSVYGGSGGDIASLAADINPAFASFVATSGFEHTTGPTGIILMDRVEPGMDMIGRIISNNYKFSLAD